MKKIIFSILFLGGLFFLAPFTTQAQVVESGSTTVDKKVLKEQAKIEKAKIKLEKNQIKITKLNEKYA